MYLQRPLGMMNKKELMIHEAVTDNCMTGVGHDRTHKHNLLIYSIIPIKVLFNGPSLGKGPFSKMNTS